MTTTSEPILPDTRPSTDHGNGSRGHPVFEWVARHARPLSISVLIVSVVLGVAGFQIRAAEANPDEPAFDPGGEIYDIQDREQDLFEAAPAVMTAQFFVEAPDPAGGDVLTQASLAEFLVEEARWLAARWPVERFCEQVDVLRDDVERLEQRVARLERRCAERMP